MRGNEFCPPNSSQLNPAVMVSSCSSVIAGLRGSGSDVNCGKKVEIGADASGNKPLSIAIQMSADTTLLVQELIFAISVAASWLR
ncbi:hypothetical protein D3C74_360890 [compost metagenome]